MVNSLVMLTIEDASHLGGRMGTEYTSHIKSITCLNEAIAKEYAKKYAGDSTFSSKWNKRGINFKDGVTWDSGVYIFTITPLVVVFEVPKDMKKENNMNGMLILFPDNIHLDDFYEKAVSLRMRHFSEGIYLLNIPDVKAADFTDSVLGQVILLNGTFESKKHRSAKLPFESK